MITALTLNVTSGSETIVLEDKYKASFIFKFVEHIKLPASSNKEILIGVLGKTPVFNELKKITTVNKEKIIAIDHLSPTTTLNQYALVFLPSTEEANFSKVYQLLKMSNTILVTENYKLIKKGADISFYTEDNKLKFEINKKKLSLKNNISNLLLSKSGQ